MVALANHLWQSSLAVCVVALLALALRRNRPQVRYALWCVASLKFLVPLAALLSLGGRLAQVVSPPVVHPQMAGAMELISRPFSETLPLASTLPPSPATTGFAYTWGLVLAAIWLAGSITLLAMWCMQWRRVSAVIRRGVRLESGREWDVLRALEWSAGITRPIALVSSPTTLEPGVFGIFRPVLLWSTMLGARLTDAQIDAILAHEVCHVRRRDNLMAAVQMLVEAMFWFHPFVWWVERRLVDERERACDADVIRSGRVPHVYAEGLLKICEWYVESPLTCVAGVTGADLKRRVETIMRHDGGAILGAWRKVLVAGVAIAGVAGPVIVGVVTAPRLRAQSLQPAVAGGTPSFDVISIKKNPDIGGPRLFPLPSGGRVRLTNQTVRTLINSAYRIQDFQIVGGAEWTRTQGFDIEAIVEATPPPAPPQMLLRIQRLLADRFKLVMHAERRQLPIYRLVKARSDGQLGPNIRPSACKPPEPDAPGGGGPSVGGPSVCGNWGGAGLMMVGGNTMSGLANQLGRVALIARPVVNETNMDGAFDWELKWTPDPPPGNSAPPDGVSIFTALQEQLGVKLEAATGSVDVLVIDSVEQPSDNQSSLASPAAPPAFEAASIKPNRSGDERVAGGFQPGGRYRVTNYTLRALIAAAYVRPQVNPDFLISGGPTWIDDEHYDVDAKAAGEFPTSAGADSASSPRRQMLQALLTERFKLRIHTESSERPIYTLVVAGGGRRLGPQLHEASSDCKRAAAGSGPGLQASPGCGTRIGPGHIVSGAVTLPQLTNLLPRFVNRVVVDRTGLDGPLAIDLAWSPAPGEWIAPPAPGESGPSSNGPSLFTALQEQLGLRLEAGRGPVDVLVIDSAQPPVAN